MAADENISCFLLSQVPKWRCEAERCYVALATGGRWCVSVETVLSTAPRPPSVFVALVLTHPDEIRHNLPLKRSCWICGAPPLPSGRLLAAGSRLVCDVFLPGGRQQPARCQVPPTHPPIPRLTPTSLPPFHALICIANHRTVRD